MLAADLESKLQDQISAAIELLEMERSTASQIETFKQQYLGWDAYNVKLLDSAFDSGGNQNIDTPSKEYSRTGLAAYGVKLQRTTILRPDKLHTVVREIQTKREFLTSLTQQISFYPQGDTLPPADATNGIESKRAPWARSELLTFSGIIVGASALSVATAVAVQNQAWIIYLPTGIILLASLAALIYFKKWRIMTVVVMAAVAAAGGMFGGYLIWNPSGEVKVSEMTASLVSHGDSNTPWQGNTSVPVSFSVQGTIKHIDETQDLWILVTQENDDHYYLQPGPCLVVTGRNQWSCQGVVVGRRGQDAGSRWQLFVVRTPKNVTKYWQEKVGGQSFDVPLLPEGVVRLDSKSVLRE